MEEFANGAIDQGLVTRHAQSSYRSIPNNPVKKMSGKSKIDSFPKKTYRWPKNT